MYKLFGIGLPRTGTSSLAKALRVLGYNGENYCLLNDNRTTDKRKFFEVNNSFYKNYKQLFFDNKDSKFILTTRDSSSWSNSIAKFLKHSSIERTYMLPNVTKYTQEVMKFFNDQGAINQLLVIDLFDESCDCSCKWKNLYEFMREPYSPPPRVVYNYNDLDKFPHVVSWWA